MSALTEKLTAYGADVPGALERFVDDEELYAECMDEFSRDPSFEGLAKALAAQDYEAAFDCAHSLKGVAGNLGLTPLFDKVCQLVEPLRAKDYSNVDAQSAAVFAELERLKGLLG